MKISEMKCILEIVNTNSLSLAAQNLYMTQPALSQLLKKAEEELGASLFIRRPGKVMELTPEGVQFVDTSRQIAALYDQFLTGLSVRRHPLRIGISERYGHNIIRALQEQAPGFSLRDYDFMELPADSREAAVLSGALDIAIVRLPLKNKGLSYKVIYDEPLGIWLRNGSPAEALAVEKPGEPYRYLPLFAVAGEPLALTSPASRIRQVIEFNLQKNHIQPSAIHTYNNMKYIFLMVENGTYSSISREPSAPTSRFFRIADQPIRYSLTMSYQSDTPYKNDLEKLHHILAAYYHSATED